MLLLPPLIFPPFHSIEKSQKCEKLRLNIKASDSQAPIGPVYNTI